MPVSHNSQKLKQGISEVISQMQFLLKLEALPKELGKGKETYNIADSSQSSNCYCVPT